MDLLTVEHVTKQYAGHKALDDVSLAIPKGSVYGLLGPNGAGKTTLIRIINRITAPDSGRVMFGGREISPEDVYRIGDRKSTRLNSSHPTTSRMPSSA